MGSAASSRPKYHFTPPSGWLNDPNGLVAADGEFHLFYQHSPGSEVWGPMHWGHAVSTDLHRWHHLPIALAPDDLGMIFSGSVVLDSHDTSGFGAGSLVAMFTHFTTEREFQSLAISRDHGRTWTTHDDNPVLRAPADATLFRDPNVTWYPTSPPGPGHWCMVLAAGNAIWFYRSDDLHDWTRTDSYTTPHCPGRYETPALFPLEGPDGTPHWVLTFGAGYGSPAGTCTRYVVGDYDGESFTPYTDAAPLLADHGPDFYAAQPWNHHPAGERVWLAWMNNWCYAEQLPTSGWRGSMTVPRRLSLAATELGPRLCQAPMVPAGRPIVETTGEEATHREINFVNAGSSLDVRLSIPLDTPPERILLELGDHGRSRITVDYELEARRLTLNRSLGRDTAVIPAFTHPVKATIPPFPDDSLDLRILLDTGSVEVFAAQGAFAMTALVPRVEEDASLVVRTEGGRWTRHNLDVRTLP